MRGLKRGRGSSGLEILLRDGVATGLTDRELLDRFNARRDPAGELAFASLVARHGPMVLGVCRRILANPADADDAFQATFLVLVRRAGSIRFGTSLGPWLYGVSVRVARRLRSVGARRSGVGPEGEALATVPDPAPGVQSRIDLRLAIDEGLGRLPDGYRAAVELCHLEGLTHEEAAHRLNCPVGTIRSRLSRGRALLQGHLEHLGIGAPDGASTPGSRPDRAGATPVVAAQLIENTARAAARLAAGRPMAGTVPARLAGIVAGVDRAMMLSKLVTTSTLLIVAGLAAWGVSVGLAAPRAPGSQSATAPGVKTGRPSRPGAVAQAPAARSRTARARDGESKSEVDLKLLAELPAVVLGVEPKLGATDVDPGLREIRVTFSKPMMDGSWSWVSGEVYANPKVDGPIRYEKDRRTCVMPVKLEPDKAYVLGINSERFRNFKDADGRPASPYLVAFRTRASR